MQRALSIIAYGLLILAAIAFAALLVVFPLVGTEAARTPSTPSPAPSR